MALLVNFRLGRKGLPGPNTLAYFASPLGDEEETVLTPSTPARRATQTRRAATRSNPGSDVKTQKGYLPYRPPLPRLRKSELVHIYKKALGRSLGPKKLVVSF